MNTTRYSRVPRPDWQDGPSGITQQTPKYRPNRGCGAWISTLWSLLLHLLATMGIMAFMIIYVNGRDFNVKNRQPEVTLPNGATARLRQFVPLQSDIITFLTGALVILRLISAAWASSLCWRGAFYLMEKPGLRRRELSWMLSFGLFTLPAYFRSSRIFIVGMILLATFLAPAASPLLLGSITWIPSSQLAGFRAQNTVAVLGTGTAPAWDEYMAKIDLREWTVRRAVGFVGLAWGREVEKNVMKRVIPSIGGLNIDSVLNNVTLPYFSVASLEWISSPQDTLPPDQLSIPDIQARLASAYNAMSPLQLGVGVLIPDAPWKATSFPPPSSVSETRTLIMYTHKVPDGGTCQQYRSGVWMFDSLPPTMGFLQFEQMCFAFARVTYTAGVGVCTNCRVSSDSTVQNTTAISLQDDFMTTEALRLMADVSVVLVQMSSSIPSIKVGVDDFVIGLLSRSYSGAWCGLADALADRSALLTSSFSAALPSLKAQVDMKRVYAWFIVQALMTFCGVAFLFMQSSTRYRLLGSTTLEALKLDATEMTTAEGDKRLKHGGFLKLGLKNGSLNVQVVSKNV